MSWFSIMAERHMQKALAEGKLQGLAGEGKPLQNLPQGVTDATQELGFRIMAEAGVLPAEITLKKQADAQRAHLATLTDPAERKAAMAALAQTETRRAIAEEARRKFMR